MRRRCGVGAANVMLALGLGALARTVVNLGAGPGGGAARDVHELRGCPDTSYRARSERYPALRREHRADARSFSIFDLTSPAGPQLIREIPVGTEPVSVQASERR